MTGADGSCCFAGFEVEGLVFKNLGESATFEQTEISALRGGGAAGVLLGELVELGTGLQLRGEVVGFGLCLSDGCVVGLCGHGDENFAEADLLGLGKLLLVSIVVGLLLSLGHLQTTAYLVANDLLGEDAVADVGLEVLERDALLTCGLFEVIHGVQMVLLADLVEPADDLGVGVDAELFGA